MKNVRWLILCVLAVCVMFSGCGSVAKPVPQEAQEHQESKVTEAEVDSFNTFGSTFEFNELEITVGAEVKWDTIDNEADDNFGADVFAVPITIKNISTETHGLSTPYATRYGSNGTKLSGGIEVYFEDSMFTMGDLRPEAENTAYMYFLYDGDGNYYIELNNRKEKVEVELPIVK